jgi:hypothetical protein
MSEKQTNVQERRVLIGQLLQEGYNSSRSIAKALKKHGIEVHHSTVARDMEQLHDESGHTTKGEVGEKRAAMIERYDARVRDLTEMLQDRSLDKREKLAVHRTLNETEGKLLVLRDKPKGGEDSEKSWETEEKRRAWNAVKLKQLRKMADEHQAKMKQQWRAEWVEEQREKGVEIVE